MGAVDEGLGPVELDAGDEYLDVSGEGEGVALKRPKPIIGATTESLINRCPFLWQ